MFPERQDNSGNAQQNIFDLYSQEEVDNFRCIFEMFDKNQTGSIEITDL